MPTAARTPAEWKARYLNALDKQERQQQLMSLLVKAILRLCMVADGLDPALDKQLAGIRSMLREGKASSNDLNTLVAALDGQLKRLGTVKSERAKAISSGFQAMLKQLQQLKPEQTAKQQLQQLGKQLPTRSQNSSDYSVLVNDYAKLQAAVLADPNLHRISKPFWHKWQPELDPQADAEPAVEPADHSAHREVELDQDIDGLDLAEEGQALVPRVMPEAGTEEPPFSKLNAMICSILKELLQQIEVPAMAKQNYTRALKQVDQGLNWYELIPTLEDLSLIVVSAFDQRQREFEAFLTTLNNRLLAAYDYISQSRQAEGAGREASRLHNDAMLDQVNAMQQSVVNANDLDQLKSEVSTRLDRIVSAMDQHQLSEQQRASSLNEQLDALVQQVKTMEAASAKAEERIEEQRQIALRDVLTQLPNREAYQQRLSLEFGRWQRYKRPLSLVVCDIDHFKQVNDNFGHLAGDKVLRIIAKTLSTRLRKTDFIGRYGGEEFVLLLPETDQAAALAVTEGVREAVASCPFHFKEQQLSITMSFGLTEFFPGDDSESGFERADKALYQAKAQGRNRCVVAESVPPTTAN